MILWNNALAATKEVNDIVEELGVVDIIFGYLSFAKDLIIALIIIVVFFILAKAIKSIVINKITTRNPDIHKEILLLYDRLIYWSIIALGFIFSFNILGVNLELILAPMSLGIGFAFKDIISNFISGVMILSQKKFKIGDFVAIGDKIGVIEEMEVRTTQIKDFDGTILIFPNSKILNTVVRNFSSIPYRRINFKVGVHYKTPLSQAISITLQTIKNNPEVSTTPEPTVRATDFSDSSIDLNVCFWVEPSSNWKAIKSQLITDLQKIYAETGIVIPYPIRSLAVDEFDDNIKNLIRRPSHR